MQFNLFLCLCLVLSFSFTGEKQQPESKPNIILIFMDDMGYGDLGCYGALQYRTPILDQLAMEGMRFTNFMSAQAVCSASRAALLTGCYPNRVGISGALFPNAKVGLHESEITIAEVLKPLGYATAIFGKWHLGDNRRFLPLQQGFDEYLGIPYSNDMWPWDYDMQRNKRHPKLPLIEGNEKIAEIRDMDDMATLTTRYTERAVDFINRHKDGPFFLYLPHSMPHTPIAASEKFRGKSEQGLYGDVMMEIDWSVGEILNALKVNGLEENTLMIFTSDNGPWLNFGNHAGSTGGLREGKGTSYEGGQREPCIMRWKGVIPPGVVTGKLSGTIDVLPTIAAVAGARLPENRIDGVNLLPLLKGDSSATPRTEFYYYYHRNNLEAVRKGDWKLVFPHEVRSYEGVMPGNDGLPGPYAKLQAPYALYDLRRDPGERYDVQSIYPEKVAELEALAEKARQDLGDDLTGRVGANLRPCGKIE